MLSGETASGEYPIECVKTMVRIAEKAETLYDRTRVEGEFAGRRKTGITQTEAVAHAVSDLAATIKAQAIVTTTTSGQTARLVSKFRPRAPIFCATWKPRTQAQMAVVWGVEAMTLPLPQTTDESIELAIDAFYRAKRIKTGDLVVVTAGVPAGTPGNTNLIFTQVV
jgi:pyruvate kinase